MTLTVYPNAKINIGLFITGKRPDGYHTLETLFYPVFSLTDVLTIETLLEGEAPTISTSGLALDGAPENNLCLKAWRLLREEVGARLGPVKILLEKKIPAGAGLGGGSSDAAFTLLALDKLFDLKVDTLQMKILAKRLGADVPFFLENRPTLASGIGDEFQPLPFDLPNFSVKLVTPPIFSETAEAYRSLTPAHWTTNRSLTKTFQQTKPDDWKNEVWNDFESVIFERFPELKAIKEKLYSEGAFYAAMTGSGSAVYGLFSEKD